MQYIAIEFMPTTRNGNASRVQPRRSIAAYKPARNSAAQPALKMAHDGVQMRLTSGHTPATWSSRPSTMPAAPHAASRHAVAGTRGAALTSPPASRPKIIVASDGTKFSVR